MQRNYKSVPYEVTIPHNVSALELAEILNDLQSRAEKEGYHDVRINMGEKSAGDPLVTAVRAETTEEYNTRLKG
jgi:hypothetical protein